VESQRSLLFAGAFVVTLPLTVDAQQASPSRKWELGSGLALPIARCPTARAGCLSGALAVTAAAIGKGGEQPPRRRAVVVEGPAAALALWDRPFVVRRDAVLPIIGR
jgi:hypothetical protein